MSTTKKLIEYDIDGNRLPDKDIELSDEEAFQEQLAQQMNEIHDQGIAAAKNWDDLTLQQKDAVLEHLLRWALYTDGRIKLGVL